MKKTLLLVCVMLFAFMNDANSVIIEEASYNLVDDLLAIFQNATSPDVEQILNKKCEYDKKENSSSFLMPKDLRTLCEIHWPQPESGKNFRVISFTTLLSGTLTEEDFHQYVRKAYIAKNWQLTYNKDGRYEGKKTIDGNEYKMVVSARMDPDKIPLITAVFGMMNDPIKKTYTKPAYVDLSEYVDLGLHSGTWWKKKNDGGHMGYGGAVEYGGALPTEAQIRELFAECSWSWTGNGYRVTGPNGNSIFLPFSGWYDNNFKKYDNASLYWSSTMTGSDQAWCIAILDSGSAYILPNVRSNLFQVRLVHKVAQ